jgi:hypothetical protein
MVQRWHAHFGPAQTIPALLAIVLAPAVRTNVPLIDAPKTGSTLLTKWRRREWPETEQLPKLWIAQHLLVAK